MLFGTNAAAPSYGTNLVQNVRLGTNLVYTRSSGPSYWTDPNSNCCASRYDFEGSTWTNDTSGNSYTLSIYSSATQTNLGANTQGRSETGAKFNGSSDYLKANGAATLCNGYSNLTVACWLRMASTPPAYAGVVGAGHSAVSKGWSLDFRSPNTTLGGYVYLTGGTIPYDSFTHGFANGVWYHVAMVWNGQSGTLTWYTNGAQAKASSGWSTGTVTQDTGVELATDLQDVTRWFPGALDAVKIYRGMTNGALTSAQVSTLYTNMGGANGPQFNNEAR